MKKSLIWGGFSMFLLVGVIALALWAVPWLLSRKPLAVSDIRFWAYQLQDVNDKAAINELATSRYDMLVLEPTRTDWSSGDKLFNTQTELVNRLKMTKANDGIHRKLIIAYVDIGQAEDWRWYWTWSTPRGESNKLLKKIPDAGDSPCFDASFPRPQGWPDYILAPDPDGWSGNYVVAYWDPKWRNVILHGGKQSSAPYGNYHSAIDEVIKDGFDGIYLDWVEAYENKCVKAAAKKQGKDPLVEMINFIKEIRQYVDARTKKFVIVQQNASALAQGHPELLKQIDAISQEGIWYEGKADVSWNDKQGGDIQVESPLSKFYITQLKAYKSADKTVFNCEYSLSNCSKAYSLSAKQNYVPYCTQKSLSRLTKNPPTGY